MNTIILSSSCTLTPFPAEVQVIMEKVYKKYPLPPAN